MNRSSLIKNIVLIPAVVLASYSSINAQNLFGRSAEDSDAKGEKKEFVGRGLGLGASVSPEDYDAPFKKLGSLTIDASYDFLHIPSSYGRADIGVEASGSIFALKSPTLHQESQQTTYSSETLHLIKHSYEDVNKSVLAGVGLSINGFPFGIRGGIEFIRSNISGDYQVEEARFDGEGNHVGSEWNETAPLEDRTEFSYAPYIGIQANLGNNLSLTSKYIFDDDLKNQLQLGLKVYFNSYSPVDKKE
ncbi:MAG: hypothetical protein ACQESE_03680 [Nanobdellota archaeon]